MKQAEQRIVQMYVNGNSVAAMHEQTGMCIKDIEAILRKHEKYIKKTLNQKQNRGCNIKWKDGLRKWRRERGLTKPQTEAIVNMLAEELDELARGIRLKDDMEIVNALADLIILSANHIEQMEYDLDLVMKETVKEISSRTGAVNPETGKWEKDTSPEAQAKWYKVDYSTCKRKDR